jgi:thiamine-phosphate pyrophosphorylase
MSLGEALWRTALELNARAGQENPPAPLLAPLFFVTDPARTPNPLAIVARLPRGAGIIYRSFGAADRVETARALAAVARERGLLFLVGADAALAEASGADGVHLPERALGDAVGLRRAYPAWRLTGAAHGAGALAAAARAGLDAALVSPVFPSRSPSAGAALGVEGFAALARGAALPVYALGGVNAATALRLIDTGAAGIAAVEGVAEAYGPKTRGP